MLSQEKSFEKMKDRAIELFTIFQSEQSNGISEIWVLDGISLNLPYDLAWNAIVELAWCSLILLILGYVG